MLRDVLKGSRSEAFGTERNIINLISIAQEKFISGLLSCKTSQMLAKSLRCNVRHELRNIRADKNTRSRTDSGTSADAIAQ